MNQRMLNHRVMSKIRKAFKKGELEVIGRKNGYSVVRCEGREYGVKGSERLTVVDIKTVRDSVLKFCECGREFETDVYHPYLLICHECRKKRRKELRSRAVGLKTCKRCSNEFTPNKFHPYSENCPSCASLIAIEKKERKYIKRIASQVGKLTKYYSKFGIDEHDFKSQLIDLANSRKLEGKVVTISILEKEAKKIVSQVS